MTATLQTAQALVREDPVAGWEALDDVFRSGQLPSQLSGRYQGGLIQLRLAPGLTELATALTRRWLPWQGKRFDASTESGDNIFSRDSLRLARVIWPRYAGYVADTPDTYRAFRFHTRADTGLIDRDRKVFVLDYDLAGKAKPKACIVA